MRPGRWLTGGIGVLAFAAFLSWQMQPPVPAVISGFDAANIGSGMPEPVADGGESAAGSSQLPEIPEADGQESDDAITIDDETTLQALFLSLAGRLEAPMREWAQTRGLPREDPNGNFMLDQPYQQYDDETLQALARNGDMWAQQILADRIKRRRPADAMELYRQAAASGSVYAMLMMANLSGMIAGMSPDFRFDEEGGIALDQYYSLRDAPVSPDVAAFAWSAVAEMAGLPGFMAMRGSGALPGDKRDAACQLAGSIYSDLLEQRAAAGLGGYPADPPPVWVAADTLDTRASCEHEQAVSYDFSDCEEYQVQNPESGQEVGFYVCQNF